MSSASIWKTAKQELFNIRFIMPAVFVALFYVVITLYLLNLRLVDQTITGNYPSQYKFTLLFDLLGGLWTAFTPLDTFLIILSALLVGANAVLISRSIKRLKNQEGLQLSIGGATIIAIITAGCSSCGFSILSIIGLSTSLSFLTFKGLELHLLATLTLLFSFTYMLKEIHSRIYCKIKK